MGEVKWGLLFILFLAIWLMFLNQMHGQALDIFTALAGAGLGLGTFVSGVFAIVLMLRRHRR